MRHVLPLEELAILAFTHFVWMMLSRTISQLEGDSKEEGVSKIAPVCSGIKLLLKKVPKGLVTFVSNRTINCIDWNIYFHKIKILSPASKACVKSIIVTVLCAEVLCIEPLTIHVFKRYKSQIIEKAIQREFKNLEELKIMRGNFVVMTKFINFFEGLREFRGKFSADVTGLLSLVRQCKNLRILEVAVSNSRCLLNILQLENLESLSLHNSICPVAPSLVQGIKKLKFISICVEQFTHDLRIVLRNLPEIKVVVKKGLGQRFMEIPENFIQDNRYLIGVSATGLFSTLGHNLCSGQQLVYISLEFGRCVFGEGENVRAADIFPFGHSCTKLKFLKLSWRVYNFPTITESTGIFPGLESVLNLEINVEEENKSRGNNMPILNMIIFFMMKCINKISVIIPLDTCVFRKMELFDYLVRSSCLTELENILIQITCATCYVYEIRDTYDCNQDNNIVSLLLNECPRLNLIGGLPGVSENMCRKALQFGVRLDKNYTYSLE